MKEFMYGYLIMSWDTSVEGGISLEKDFRSGFPTIKGSWLWELIKNDFRAEETCYYIGRDELYRVEIAIYAPLFETLKTNRLFIHKCKHLRRLRSYPSSGPESLLSRICLPIADFDNDLDQIKP